MNYHDMYFDRIHRGCCAGDVFVEVEGQVDAKGNETRIQSKARDKRASGFTSDVTTLGGVTLPRDIYETFLFSYITETCESGL